IKDARIVDGSGNPWFRGQVGVRAGRIETVWRREPEVPAARVLDAAGMVLCPGFIDLHSHSDYSIWVHNRAESALRMGVTTEAVGQCGMTVHTLARELGEKVRRTIATFALVEADEVEVSWGTLGEWRSALESRRIGINLAPFIGHGTVRESVMGLEGKGGERCEPGLEELEKMKALVAEGMEQGAFGLSTGLRYAPGRNAFTEEVIELARVVARYGGAYTSHIRSEEEYLVWAVGELIRIGREAGLPACVSHHKAMLPENWGKVFETVRMLERARAEGVDVICDLYPWTLARQANLGSWFAGHILSPDSATVAREELLSRLGDDGRWAEVKQAARAAFAREVEVNGHRRRFLARRGVMVPDIWDPETFDYIVWSPGHPEVEGKNFRQAAAVLGYQDYWDAVRRVYLDDRGFTQVAAGGMAEEDVGHVLRWPWSCVSTDGFVLDSPPDLGNPGCGAHPRQYGTYPKVLGQYVRETGGLRLEEAVRKMTSLPAGFLGLRDRGAVREGMWADLVIFDPETVACTASYHEPARYPVGIEYVLVNGEVVIDRGRHTGALVGRVLAR
ncbi:MAG: D-aminoacylase, partial [Bacillota bacterium]